MDSGANMFIFLPVFGIPGTLAPSLHCLTPATSWPAQVPLHSAEVMSNMHYSFWVMRWFLQHAFIHAQLNLFQVSLLLLI